MALSTLPPEIAFGVNRALYFRNWRVSGHFGFAYQRLNGPVAAAVNGRTASHRYPVDG